MSRSPGEPSCLDGVVELKWAQALSLEPYDVMVLCPGGPKPPGLVEFTENDVLRPQNDPRVGWVARVLQK